MLESGSPKVGAGSGAAKCPQAPGQAGGIGHSPRSPSQGRQEGRLSSSTLGKAIRHKSRSLRDSPPAKFQKKELSLRHILPVLTGGSHPKNLPGINLLS